MHPWLAFLFMTASLLNPEVSWVYDLNQPALTAHILFVATAGEVMECESGGRDEKVGNAGERGYLQIHPVHREGMRDRGLRFEDTHDRMRYGYLLWQVSRWGPWSCKPIDITWR